MTEVPLATRHAAQGARIHTARLMRDLTEAELAAAMDMRGGKATVARWESGESQPLYGNRRRLVEVLRVPYHRLFVPEEVARSIPRGPSRFLLTAHGLPGSSPHLYVETAGKGADRTNAVWLTRFLLVEDNGWDSRRRTHLWHVTAYGEDVLEVLRHE